MKCPKCKKQLDKVAIYQFVTTLDKHYIDSNGNWGEILLEEIQESDTKCYTCPKCEHEEDSIEAFGGKEK